MALPVSQKKPSFLHNPRTYKWIALSNTTLGILMASMNQTILIISLPAIFRGLHIMPLANGQTDLLLWILMGFNVATTVLLVSFGRISDSAGRVKLYNLGFLVFTIGSFLLYLTPSLGTAGEWEIIMFRFIQGIGGAFLFANSAAILTDAFPAHERGFALGLNQIAAIAGGVLGLIVGGILSTINWRMVFLVNVPFGLIGTVWAYIALKETAKIRDSGGIDWLGNMTFALGLLGILLGLTYSISPYHTHAMGWQRPIVVASLISGVILLIAFVVLEKFVRHPMFPLSLFKNRAFSIGNVSSLLAAVARGGLSFMLIIWLQGIWLPLHGVSFAHTPLQAGIDSIPQMVGFLVVGPFSGYLSDKYGARLFATFGMAVAAIGFYLLSTLPADFHYWTFASWIFLVGAGQGLFSSPNTASIMNSVPARFRGAASGMRATFMNAGMMLSMGIFFTILISSLSLNLPRAIRQGLSGFAIPHTTIAHLSHIPPMAVLFAALLGFNPLKTLLPATVLHRLPAGQLARLTGHQFFPQLISHAFMTSLRVVFLFSAALTLIAAILSAFRGNEQYNEDDNDSAP